MKNSADETGPVCGIKNKNIELLDHDPTWQDDFQRHAKIIAAALGGEALRIEHVGSTSVPGLAAKPIIDILLVVADSGDESSYLPTLKEAGYVLRVREPDFHEHRMLRTFKRDVHVHVFSPGSPEIERYLTFRDHLRRNPDERLRYEETKRQLARSFSDKNAYADAKTEIIEDIIAAARAAGEVSQ